MHSHSLRRSNTQAIAVLSIIFILIVTALVILRMSNDGSMESDPQHASADNISYSSMTFKQLMDRDIESRVGADSDGYITMYHSDTGYSAMQARDLLFAKLANELSTAPDAESIYCLAVECYVSSADYSLSKYAARVVLSSTDNDVDALLQLISNIEGSDAKEGLAPDMSIVFP